MPRPRWSTRPSSAACPDLVSALVIEDMAPEPVKKNGHLEGSNTEALTEELNVLAKQGWELVAIEPYSEQQTKTVQGTVIYHHYPTYVFKRPK